MGGQPVVVYREDTERTRGATAQKNNILAATIVAEAVKSTLGPRGMDKMLVDQFGDVTITNDGATILSEIDVQHPAAKIMVQVAKTQDEEAGDGTTTSVILAGELLKNAAELLEKGIHASVIIKGYSLSKNYAEKELEKLSQAIDVSDRATLRKIAMTTMGSKAISGQKEMFADIVVDSVKQILTEENGKRVADIDLVKIVKKEGKSLEETEFVKGVVIDKEVVHPGMPKVVKGSKIALIDSALEIEKTEFDAKISITSPDQVSAFLKQEELMHKKTVDKIVASGANVLFTQKGIDDTVQFFLAEAGIMAVRRNKKSDMEKISKATGARIVTNVDSLAAKDLGYAGLVEEANVGDESMIYIKECKDPKSVTIVLRGGTEHIVNESDRATHDALCVVRNAVEDLKFVPGGGAIELELSQRVKKFADTLSGREQIAARAYAKSLEVVPTALAVNAGHDPIDTLASLRVKHEVEGNLWFGVNIFSGKPTDVRKSGVFETERVKRQILKSATEAANMILRIDDIIAAKKSAGGGMPPGMPPGMGM
ncbi:MAG: thermosome subunit beta [Candidatus Ranarchaeia archaeon]